MNQESWYQIGHDHTGQALQYINREELLNMGYTKEQIAPYKQK